MTKLFCLISLLVSTAWADTADFNQLINDAEASQQELAKAMKIIDQSISAELSETAQRLPNATVTNKVASTQIEIQLRRTYGE